MPYSHFTLEMVDRLRWSSSNIRAWVRASYIRLMNSAEEDTQEYRQFRDLVIASQLAELPKHKKE